MLTDTTIKQVRSSKKTQKLFDGYRTGLHLLVHPGGRKTFAIKYPHPITKKERTFTIGPYPHITLKEARAETEKARTLLVHGIDPQEDKIKRKAEIKAAHVDTFEQLANDWIKFRRSIDTKFEPPSRGIYSLRLEKLQLPKLPHLFYFHCLDQLKTTATQTKPTHFWNMSVLFLGLPCLKGARLWTHLLHFAEPSYLIAKSICLLLLPLKTFGSYCWRWIATKVSTLHARR
jgi:hypothetical protein